MHINRRLMLGLALATALSAPQLARAEDTIRIGLLASFISSRRPSSTSALRTSSRRRLTLGRSRRFSCA